MRVTSAPQRLVLASGSRYRGELLRRLGLDFDSDSPDVEESALDGEMPAALAMRLARSKAEAVQPRHAGAWVIGSDQVASTGSIALGKPGTLEAAQRQLQQASGNEVGFHTAVCLLGPDGQMLEHVDLTRVRFRDLDDATIHRYLAQEPALDCAGSFKVEGLGISLLEAVHSEDPTALVGLPLVALCAMLRGAGFALP